MDPIRIVVTEPEYVKAERTFRQARDLDIRVCDWAEDALARTVADHHAFGAILGVEKYAGALYDALPRKGILARFGVGHDGVNKPLATARGLLVTNTPGVLEDAVAEHAIALILGVAKNLNAFSLAMHAGEWTPRLGFELRGRTLGIVGCGGIGRRLARFANAFGMTVLGADPNPASHAELERDWGFSSVTADLQEVLSQAQIVSLHVPANERTHHMVDADLIDSMRDGAILVNTARGPVVDEVAVYDALVSGKLASAALDVFEAEPYVPVDPARDLRLLPNVLLTPHVSSSSVEACERMACASMENVRRAFAGAYDSLSLINVDVLETLSHS
jgi:phosphoglycerate dehydrogenase-like enzyme